MLQGKAGAQKIADNAVPATKRFNEEQLKPGAEKAGEGLKTGADRASKGLQNAADQVSQQAGQRAFLRPGSWGVHAASEVYKAFA